jgi:hypothetical protein
MKPNRNSHLFLLGFISILPQIACQKGFDIVVVDHKLYHFIMCKMPKIWQVWTKWGAPLGAHPAKRTIGGHGPLAFPRDAPNGPKRILLVSKM